MTNHTIIIAEAGVNHNGSIELAKKLVEKAKEAGADYIKFQTFNASKLVTKAAKQAEYQQKNIGKEGDSQYLMLKKLEFSPSQYNELVEYCNLRGIKFFSTAFDFDSIEYLHSLNLGLWKVPSGEVTNYPLLKRIAAYNEKTILSTGMCDMEDVRDAVNALYKNGLSKENLILLHCNTEYPTPFEDVNLKAMDALRKEFGVEVGYSDHTKGIEVPIAAVALGATVIEKHFTLDRNMEGPDHKASLETDELKAMVSAIRNIEKAVGGDGTKHVSESEKKNIAIARKSIVAACDIKAGEVFTEQNLTVKRPGSGISPMRWEEVVGTKAKRDFSEDELIEI
jgi:N,N'-diacetyllegionaminate synthase